MSNYEYKFFITSVSSHIITFLLNVYIVDVEEKKRIQRIEKWREEESRKWFNELRETHPEIYESIVGKKDNLH